MIDCFGIKVLNLKSLLGEYLELSEDKDNERHMELLAEFERRKRVRSGYSSCSKATLAKLQYKL